MLIFLVGFRLCQFFFALGFDRGIYFVMIILWGGRVWAGVFFVGGGGGWLRFRRRIVYLLELPRRFPRDAVLRMGPFQSDFNCVSAS